MQQPLRAVWLVGDDWWIVEFPDPAAARAAADERLRLEETEGEAEADAWAEEIIARHGGRIL